MFIYLPRLLNENSDGRSYGRGFAFSQWLKLSLLMLGLTGLGLTRSAAQTTVYWDLNGSATGAGGVSPSGIWNTTSNNWSTNANGTIATTKYVSGNAAVFSAGADATGAYTITVAGTQNTTSIRTQDGTVTFSGGIINFMGASPQFNVASGLTTIVNSVIAGSSGFTKSTNSGTLLLTGANTYSGTTAINTGALIAASNTALGSITYGNTVASGAALQFQGGITMNEGSFTVTGTGVGGTGALSNLNGTNALNAAVTVGGNTTIGSTAGALAISGQVDLGATNTLTVAGAGNITLSGFITNSGSLAKTGAGTLTLSGTSANSFGGVLGITDGTVLLNKTAGTNAVSGSAINVGNGSGAAGSAILRLGASNQIADYAGVMTIASDGLFDVNNQTESIDRLAGNGQIDLGASGTLTVGVNSGNSTFGGTILGAGTLIKAGSGSLTLAATLAITGELQLNSGTIFLGGYNLSAGTLHITGNSTIDFAGGNSTLTATNFTIDAGVTLTVANWTNAADFFFAQNWSGATVNTSGAAPMNQVSFAGFSPSNTKWQGYDSQVTPVPEPSTYGAWLVGLVLGVRCWRRGREVASQV